VLAGCASAPPAPPAPSATAVVTAPATVDNRVAQAIARHRQQAAEYRRAGDHADEAAQWQILTLLAPDESVFARELATARASIAATVQEQSQVGNAALTAGDLDRASTAFLRVLAADPANAEAAKQMREVDRRRLAKIQAAAATRAARAGGASIAAADSNDGFDLDQAFELFRAGDTVAGLREFRAYVDANPTNRAVRQRIGAVVADRAKDLEDDGSREQALAMYEQASSLRGDSAGPWVPRIATLRKSLSVEAYDKALRVYRTDLAQAVRLLETSVKYDPANALATARLKEARVAQANLSKIDQRGKGK
jgi:tetratricopeptide (TPR) repeat protein